MSAFKNLSGRLAALLAISLFALALPGAAQANSYNVNVCGSAAGADNAFSLYDNNSVFSATNTCGSGGSLHVSFLTAASEAYGTQAAWVFNAPAGMSINSITGHLDAGMSSTGGWDAGLRDQNGAVIWGCDRVNGSCAKTNTGTIDTNGASALSLGVICLSNSGTCGDSDTPSGYTNLYSASVNIEDDTPPSLTVAGDNGSDGFDGYQSGTMTVNFDGSSPAGISGAALTVDGQGVALVGYPCNYTYPVPCSNVTGGALQLDTTKLTDGQHTLDVIVADPAGNTTDQSETFTVSNQPPGPVQGISANDNGDGTYDIDWSDPTVDGAPIMGAYYTIDKQPAAVALADWSYSAGDGAVTVGPLSPGNHTIYVWLVNAAGHSDPSTAQAVTITVPGSGDGGGGNSGGGGGNSTHGGTHHKSSSHKKHKGAHHTHKPSRHRKHRKHKHHVKHPALSSASLIAF